MFVTLRKLSACFLLLACFTQCKAKFHSVDKSASGSGGGDATENNVNAEGNQQTVENVAGAKNITFTANGTASTLSIDPGTAVTLAWTATGYDSCKIEPLSLTGLTGTHDLGAVSTAQTYTITCTKDSTTDTKNVAIILKIAPTGPSADLKINGQDGPITINYGTNINVTWTSENATACSLSPTNETGLTGNKTYSNMTATTNYVLSCTNAAQQTTQDSVSVNVNTPPPLSGQFFVNGSGGPVYVNSGSSIDLAWSAQNAATCTVTPGNFTGVSGTQTVTNVTQSAKYSLYCEGPGGTLAIDIMVYVNNTVIGTLDLKVNGSDGAVNIPYGSDINVTWTSDKANTCEVVFPNQKFTSLTGSTTVTNVTMSQSLLMVCTYTGGIPQYDYVTVVVESAPAPTVSIKANGVNDFLVVLPGDNIELAWNSQNANTCTVSPGNFAGLNSSQTVTNVTLTTTFIVTCSGTGGTAVDAVVVHVNTVVAPPKVAPTADLKVNGSDGPIDVAKGSTVTATWSSANATQCSLTPTNAIGTVGSKAMTVQKQTLFTLTCVGPGGTMTDFVTVRTTTGNTDTAIPKPTADLKINGSDGPIKAYKGENITLQWWSTDASTCVINPGFYSGLSGSQIHNAIQQTTTFILHCSGNGGDFIDQVTVNVDNGSMAPLVDIKANTSDGPLDITLGETVNLQWTTQFATDCTLLQTGATGITGNINIGAPQQTIVYTLVCRGSGGVSFDSVAINVRKPTIDKLSCSIYIHRNHRHGCGPNDYEYWYLWVQDVPPALQNGIDPPKAWVKDTKLKGVYGLKENKCNNNSPTPMPQTYTYQGYTYKLWTNGVAGSADCKVFLTTFSPLILSFTTDRMEISAPNDGPIFDLAGEGRSHYSWPTNMAKHMFLVHDKNGNGQIDSIEEMFGNNTTGPDGKKAENGFETLKKFDANRDGQINAADPVYQLLRLWSDVNADGITDPGELFSLQSKSVRSINLKYKQGQTRLDQYGNESKESSTFDLVSGRTLPIVDYWFAPGQAE